MKGLDGLANYQGGGLLTTSAVVSSRINECLVFINVFR